jgi:hypothetical protein
MRITTLVEAVGGIDLSAAAALPRGGADAAARPSLSA